MSFKQAQTLPATLFASPPFAPVNLHFRLAAAEDLQPLYQCCYSEQPFSRFRAHFHQLLKWQMSGRGYWLVVEAGADGRPAPIGSGQLTIYGNGGELANLAVTAARQGQGIGTAIIEILTGIARHLTLSSLEIGVAIQNRRALALYQRLGFRQDRWLKVPGEGKAIILRKEL